MFIEQEIINPVSILKSKINHTDRGNYGNDGGRGQLGGRGSGG